MEVGHRDLLSVIGAVSMLFRSLESKFISLDQAELPLHNRVCETNDGLSTRKTLLGLDAISHLGEHWRIRSMPPSPAFTSTGCIQILPGAPRNQQFQRTFCRDELKDPEIVTSPSYCSRYSMTSLPPSRGVFIENWSRELDVDCTRDDTLSVRC